MLYNSELTRSGATLERTLEGDGRPARFQHSHFNRNLAPFRLSSVLTRQSCVVFAVQQLSLR